MRIASLADVKARLSAYIDQAEADGPVIITRNGKPAAVLVVPKDEDDLEIIVLGRSPRLRTILENSRQQLNVDKGTSQAELGTPVASSTDENQAVAAMSETELLSITEQINRALAIQDSELDPFFVELQTRSLPKDEW